MAAALQNIARTMHIQTIWPEAIVVYPQGLPTPTRIDPAGKRPGWQIAVGAQGDRDLKFVDAMLAAINKRYRVDKHRIYATGFSNGGVFMYVLWSAPQMSSPPSLPAPACRLTVGTARYPNPCSLSPAKPIRS